MFSSIYYNSCAMNHCLCTGRYVYIYEQSARYLKHFHDERLFDPARLTLNDAGKQIQQNTRKKRIEYTHSHRSRNTLGWWLLLKKLIMSKKETIFSNDTDMPLFWLYCRRTDGIRFWTQPHITSHRFNLLYYVAG